MKREELKAVAAMSDAALAAYSVYETAAIEAHVAQANAAGVKLHEAIEAHATASRRAAEELLAAKQKHAGEVLAEVAAAVSPLRERIASLETDLSAAVSLVEAMGGTEVGLRLAKEKRAAELVAAKQKIDDELSKLG